MLRTVLILAALPVAAQVLENPALRVTLDAGTGALIVRDKKAGYDWRQTSASAVANVKATRTTLDFEQGQSRVRITLPPSGMDLFVETDMADRQTRIESLPSLAPFVLDTPAAALAIADYTNGHLYPLDAQPFPRKRFQLTNIDMPWFGVCDARTGLGYAVIAETPDDGYIEMQPAQSVGRELMLPRVFWTPSHREFRYARKLFYHFTAAGGYVALAKRYRAHAAEIGVLVPFTDKLKKNPNIARLFGAPDVWGDGTLAFARAAKEAGVAKMLIHTSPSANRRTGITPEEMKAINEMGYLSSTYDNYTDIMPLEPGKEVETNRDKLPEHAVLRADGTRMTAWLTMDKKQFMKRCPAFWAPTAKVVIPKDLARFPYLGRFIDVTTAEDLYECYDPEHPLTRTTKRERGHELLGHVRSLGLVTGGEHGRWWAVPYLDYIEGMMSTTYASWPAGHLRRPKTKDQEFIMPSGAKLGPWSNYEKWGIGHEYRIPLWELVFHDCVVSTWYWGDSSDFLLEAAPEVTLKKDAFNVLYGTMPMLWANEPGSWRANREMFLRTYRNTCKMHEAVATAELLSHEFVTADRAVQRSRFSDGTQAVVNFGAKPYTVKLGGRTYVLPQNGFAVKGPRIEQSLSLKNGKVVTEIRTASFHFTG